MSFVSKVTKKYEVAAKKYTDFDAFSKEVGLIKDEKTLKKIGAPIKNSSFDGDRWSADSDSAKALNEFVKNNPKYHVVTQLDPEDADDGSMIFIYDNCMRVVNRLSYYLADGNKNTNISCTETDD